MTFKSLHIHPEIQNQSTYCEGIWPKVLPWHPPSSEAMAASTSISLHGLAEIWEGDSSIRQTARTTGQIVQWPNPEVVGIPSMNLG